MISTRLVGLASALALVVPMQAGVATAGGTGANCPGPWCDRYEFVCFDAPSRCAWPAGADGLIHVEYWINPRQPWMSEADAFGGIRAAFSAWEPAQPRFRMRYMGTTDQVAAKDDRLVVSFMDPGGGGSTIIWDRRDCACPPDIMLGTTRMAWHPCEQADNSCGVYEKQNWWQYQAPLCPSRSTRRCTGTPTRNASPGPTATTASSSG